MDNYFGFSPESFEQFARALSLKVFGPGVTIFGDGKDKGREAIFRGTVSYPSPPASLWSGYGVIQAKCKTKTETTEKNQQWALGQLKKELDLFANRAKKRELPEYYVYITNVHLSAAGRGWDEGNRLISSYKSSIPTLKGHVIWGGDQITGFLSIYEDLRRRFVAYLTPGDVLASLIEEIERDRPKAHSILTAYLDSSLRADASSRLDQAGNRSEEQLRLSDLFFDLAVSASERLTPPNEALDSQGRLPSGVLEELLVAGSRRLDPHTVFELETSKEHLPGSHFPTRYVLLGGFGSGKSTVAQFLAQVHRAALLARVPQHNLETPTRDLVGSIRRRCELEQLSWPATPRYPFRVELLRFARALAEGRVASLMGYFLTELRGDYKLPYESLREWLGAYPWLVILDGLDEVPATSNRQAVVAAVDTFLAEARRADADLFVVATSRKDGYEGEFRSGVVALQYICPLSAPRAMRYVEYYAKTKFGATDPGRQQDLIDKLQSSVANPLTSQLMGTPLQVTFMATVVAARGSPGTDRWQLFSKYYQTIYDREQQKAVDPYAQVLADHATTITRLHQEVGFWLQSRGEIAGKNAVSISLDQFRDLSEHHLHLLGFDGKERSLLIQAIVDLAQRRLVFLTSRVEGELAFDVRGLQEFMASEHLMAGERPQIRDRLRAIAPHVYWRNVFLFATGKCFSDPQSAYLQDEVRLLCADLNDSESTELSGTRIGCELALAILESGAIGQNRTHARHLARIALGTLAVVRSSATDSESPDNKSIAPAVRLAAVYQDYLSSIYPDELRLHLRQADIMRSLAAWPLVSILADRGVSWASQIQFQEWPTDIISQAHVLVASEDLFGWLLNYRDIAVRLLVQLPPKIG
ncbi:hypothetical protein J0H58_38190, partial [bacterium]|nr:hypothetical protein [bacterium]